MDFSLYLNIYFRSHYVIRCFAGLIMPFQSHIRVNLEVISHLGRELHLKRSRPALNSSLKICKLVSDPKTGAFVDRR